ncbi:MAG TPA: restriction endonuclease [Propionibacteriaceae bacterium]|nr:restriction endonuclease [Propionibacteriaceae bacterium]
MHDASKLRALIAEYGQLQSLSGSQRTPQARGIRFNELIAEMLGCWGIEAEVSNATAGAGEIDVTFAVDGDRYLIEAKWEKDKTDAGPLSKLEKRLKQRLRGPIGICLSMAGFTSDAVNGLDKGSQLEMLLLDRTHFEAMLSGLVPPQELLKLAHDRAAFRGQAYSSLLDLLAPKQKTPAVSFGSPPELEDALSSNTVKGANARVLFTMSDSNQLGITSVGPGMLLVTHQEGIAEVDTTRQKAVWKVPVRGCHRNPLRDEAEAVVFTRRHGIGRLAGDELTIIGGGLQENSSLINRHDGSAWTVDSDPLGASPSSAVTKFGASLGQQYRYPVVAQWSQVAIGADWLDDDRLALVHASFCSVTRLDGGVARGVSAHASDCAAILALDAQTVLIAGGPAELQLIDLASGRRAEVARLALRPSAFELAAGPDTSFYLASYYGSSAMDVAVVEVQTLSPTPSFVRQAFARADTGDLPGYFEQIARIANRSTPLPLVTEPQLNALYNDARRLVGEGLRKPIERLVEDAGLQLVSQNVPRRLDGWPPPEYGGSATQHRWRLPSAYDGTWLEASIGVSHRAWPTNNLNDLIITLMIARMNEQTQHTLLTRFVPFELDDPLLQNKIEALFIEAKAVLPQAIEGLRGTSTNPSHGSRTDNK